PGIAPSRKEGALTPRCPCTKAYRAVARRRGAYAAMPLWGYRGLTSETLQFDLWNVQALPESFQRYRPTGSRLD
ncbi:MAG TPA: hypothetical protein PK291_10330, partial [Thermotogota bacterium]|nr:hypothetical protein [Thermotogota bacterium]